MGSEFGDKALEASSFLKAISHEDRLQILCLLLGGERSVSEIQTALSLRQAGASQHIARLRLEGLIAPRRDGKNIYYRISNQRVAPIVAILLEVFGSEAD
ncbi:ArsR/SmtB family transcription factor [Ruegeria meonggei]|uniref:ArsR/SmtB family transcription factor n=1 Tax=Ruegeria meonggei TaxID=1446476 RepID=UPI000A268711|nr:metalloregulator ArsR/SmtB family transcription factor [Ruegeria meonggei]